MGHTFRRLYDAGKRDDFVLCASLGLRGTVQLGVVSDAPSSAPAAVGTAVDQIVRAVVQSYSRRLADDEADVRSTEVQSLIVTLVVEVQEALRSIGSRDAVTNLAVAATFRDRLFYFVLGDSFVLVLRGREFARAGMLHLGANSVWNGREPVTRDNLDAFRTMEIEGRKYIGGEMPPIYPLPGDVPSVEIGPGDWVLVASDGLTAHLEPGEVFSIYENADSCAGFARELEASIPNELRDDVSVAVFEPHVPSVRDVFQAIEERRSAVAAELGRVESEVSVRIRSAQQDALESLAQRHDDAVQTMDRRIVDFGRGVDDRLRIVAGDVTQALARLDSLARRVGAFESAWQEAADRSSSSRDSLGIRLSNLEARVDHLDQMSRKAAETRSGSAHEPVTDESAGPRQDPRNGEQGGSADLQETASSRELSNDARASSFGGSAKKTHGRDRKLPVAAGANDERGRPGGRGWLPFVIFAVLIVAILAVLGWFWRMSLPAGDSGQPRPVSWRTTEVELYPTLLLGDAQDDFTRFEPYATVRIGSKEMYAHAVDQNDLFLWESEPAVSTESHADPCGRLDGYNGRVLFLTLFGTQPEPGYEPGDLEECWPEITNSEFFKNRPESVFPSPHPPARGSRAPERVASDDAVVVWLQKMPDLYEEALVLPGRAGS